MWQIQVTVKAESGQEKLSSINFDSLEQMKKFLSNCTDEDYFNSKYQWLVDFEKNQK